MKTNIQKDSLSNTIKALHILDLIAETPSPLTVEAIAQALRYKKDTVKRVCLMFEKERYLTSRLDGRGFLPGPRLSKMARDLFVSNNHLRSVRHTILRRLSNELGKTCSICIPDGSKMIYSDRVETHWPLRIKFNVNDRVPLYCTSTGKLYLSSLPDVIRSKLLKRILFLPKTFNTITTVAGLEKEFIRIRKEGVSIDNQEFMHGMICLAVPIANTSGRFIAGLSVNAPATRLSLEEIPKILPLLRRAAQELSQSYI